ncbi:Protein unc-13 D [Orchesella cincta]|uniref:Protein unc-13 D n=1 Tax=Orchesella cincta TaxID=48709 RepID=A0A1D2MC60_ORCCI|nr:Protein unc-13 D [Orchesella cincta]
MQTFQRQLDRAYESFLNQLVSTSEDLNIIELYTEILCVLLHHRRFCDDNQSENNPLIEHLQKVFNVDNDKHAELLATAENKDDKPLVLNLKVIEARDLKGKDGLSDPSCTVFVSPTRKKNTSVKSETLNPVWQECFSLPVSNGKEDVFHIEVWDKRGAETVAEKVRRINDVKSGKSLKNFMRELTKGSNGKEKRDSLGCFKLPLKDIPMEGIDAWYPLESRSESSSTGFGEIHLRLGLGLEKEKKVAVKEYYHVLHLMLAYELVHEQNIDPYEWDGGFNNEMSKTVLQTLEFQGGLNKKEIDLAHWGVYTNVHCGQHALNAKIFPPLLEVNLEHLKSNIADDFEEMQKYWISMEQLVENFASFFQNMHRNRHLFSSSYDATFCALDMLKTLAMLKFYLTENPNITSEYELKLSADWIIDRVKNAIFLCANTYFDSVASHNWKLERAQVEHMVKVGERLIADLEKCLDIYQNDFQMSMGIDYFGITYQVYDQRFASIVEPLVEQISSFPTSQQMNDDEFTSRREDEFAIGTTLFKLYLKLKQFAALSTNVESPNEFCVQGNFHKWFDDRVVFYWLRIAKFKAENCIRAAVVRDNFQPLGDSSRITSSAVDTAGYLQRIEIWNQLSSSEMQSWQSCIAKILEDLGKCVLFYANLISEKVAQIGNDQEENYQILDKVCFTVNNIERVADEMKLIGVNFMTAKLALRDTNSVADQQPKLTLIAVMEQAAKNISEKKSVILEDVGLKMRNVIQQMMTDATDSGCDEDYITILETYLEYNLQKLNKKLSKPTFATVFGIIWRNVSASIQHVTKTNIENGREPKFFQELQKVVTILNNFFQSDDGSSRVESTSKITETDEIEKLLEIHGASTSDLILRYFVERHKMQSYMRNKTPSKLGYLAVRAQYCDDIKTLRIELLNARNLKPGDSNGVRDPFLKVILVTDTTLPIISLHKSKVKKKTLFPWFDESFSSVVTIDPDELSHGILMFTLKDYGLLGKNDYIGDCYLPLKSVPFTNSDMEFKELPQEVLPLNLPTIEELDTRIFQALERRQCDKDAVEFVKRERTKCPSILYPSRRRSSSSIFYTNELQ